MPWPWKPSYGSVKIIGNVTIRYNAYDFLLTFYNNYGSISCRFWGIQCQKMLWPWNPGQMSLKIIESGTFWKIGFVFLLVFYSKFVPKMHRFRDIRLQKCRDLENLTLKTEVRVCEGRWKYHHSIERIWLPIDVLVQLWLYLVSFLRYSMSKNISTLKSRSRVNQGHWKLYHSIDWVWFLGLTPERWA